jgi:hypothetical protein
MGWEAKQKGTPWRPCHAESEGSGVQERRWFRVNSDWGSKSGQRLGGKVVWQDEKVEIRWFLAVRMARSAGRERWFWGGGVLKGKGDGAKKGGEIGRGFVVNFEEGERVGERLEERDDGREGGDL